jgi:hypothetical protein
MSPPLASVAYLDVAEGPTSASIYAKVKAAEGASRVEKLRW